MSYANKKKHAYLRTPFKGTGYALGKQLCQNCLFPTEKRSALKGKSLLAVVANYFFLKRTLFQRFLVCRKTHRESQKLSPL